MKDETIQLVKLINENKTLNEISTITGLSNKQLFTKLSMLRSSGYLIDKKYYYNGEISYALTDPFVTPCTPNQMTIEVPNDVDQIRVVLTSDTHLGHISDNTNLVDTMTNFCVKEGIHNIFHTGDFLHGIYPNDQKKTKIKDGQEQIKYALQSYPYVRDLNTFICLGNHDATLWLKDGIDIRNVLLERRHDLVPVGYGNAKINILGTSIYLHHPIKAVGINSLGDGTIHKSLILKGHSHRFKVLLDQNANTVVHVPTLGTISTALSDPSPYTNIVIPSIVAMGLKRGSNNQVYAEFFEHFIVLNNQLIKINEIECYAHLASNQPKEQPIAKKPQLISISNIEMSKVKLSTEPPKVSNQSISKVKINHNQYQGLSQIEKFNTRFGISQPPTLKKVLKKN